MLESARKGCMVEGFVHGEACREAWQSRMRLCGKG